ncbi:MAG TPA: prepilin peptidase, partial [Isosphaeraceae bacterium]|nr:prepilin peptidase [Isosphaeraceae bacterium]
MTWTHHAIVLAFLFGLGAAVGSFLNVCIYRIPARMSLLRPPSRCPRCASAIAPRDNVPILGWLALRGRCRSCRLPISVRYPLVEALAGVLFAAAYPAVLASAPGDLLDAGIDLAVARLLHHALLVALVITAAFIGHDTGNVPRRLTVTGMALGLALGTVLPAARPEGAMARTPGGGFAVGAFGLLLGVSLAQLARLVARRTGHPEAIGGDDGALLAMIGAFLGGRVILPILLIAAVLVCLCTALAPGRLLAFRSYLGTA